MKTCGLINILAVIAVSATLICSSRPSMYHNLVIEVNEQKGSDNETCLTISDSFCQSLEFITIIIVSYKIAPGTLQLCWILRYSKTYGIKLLSTTVNFSLLKEGISQAK